MGATTIEWTDFTFNPWMGCQHVSPGCEHCYAETFAKRVGHGGSRPRIWGPGSERRMMSEAYWRAPLRWDRAAATVGVRRRVFCASMADVFDDRPELVEPRARLYKLIDATLNLDWLLLTKRPENADRLWVSAAVDAYDGSEEMGPTWRRNVWIGTTVEDQRRAERLDHLCAVPAAVRFVSAEPLLSAVDLSRWMPDHCRTCGGTDDIDEDGECQALDCDGRGLEPWRIDWVIAGGESGPGARPMHPQWARLLRDQCAAAGVPFLFKQWGEYLDLGDAHELALDPGSERSGRDRIVNHVGGHGFHGLMPRRMRRVGKHISGRTLDGRTHDEFPGGVA